MRKQTVLFGLVFFFILAGSALADFDELIQKIDKVWQERSDNTGPMKDALAQAEQAYGEKPGFEAAWRAARACFWICDRTEDSITDQKYGKRGYEWAEKAVQANPEAVEGHYYYTICLGEYGKGISIVTALAKGLGNKYEAACNKAIQIKAGYEDGAPYRALGRYYFSLPWPKYSFEKAEKAYLKSLSLGPGFSRTLYYMAELYAKEKKFDKAKEYLKQMESPKDYPYSAWEQKYYQKLGKDLAEEIKDK